MNPSLKTVLSDLAHEREVHSAYDTVPRRLKLEPVKWFIMEDLVVDNRSLRMDDQ